MPSVPADGESLIWGAITIRDVDGKPVPGAVVEIHTTAGTIHWIGNHPLTNENGQFIFALQSTLQPSSFQVRFNFPQFGIGGTLLGSFCRIGEPGCFLPGRCADFRVGLEYYFVEHDHESLRCTTTVADMYKFYAADSPEPPTLYFSYVTFKNNRPEGAFPERRLYLDYWECNDPYGIREYCRCLSGSKEGTLDYTYGWNNDVGRADIGMPNGENTAEVTYLQYSTNGAGRVCKKEFRFNVSNPLVRIASDDWIIFSETEQTQTVELDLISPHWQGDLLLQVQTGTTTHSVNNTNLPGRVLVQIQRTPYSGLENEVPYQIAASLGTFIGSFVNVDTTASWVHMDLLNLTALGYNSQQRTFDFAIRYRLRNTRSNLQRTPLVSQGRIDVHFGNDVRNPIHSENIASEYFTEGEHTVIVRIPENQMTRFGTYHFIPRFTDNFARYYRDEQPRQVVVGRALSFRTPTLRGLETAYAIRNITQLNNQTRERLMFPFAGDAIDIVAFVLGADSEVDLPTRYSYGTIPRTSVYVGQVNWSNGEPKPVGRSDFFDRTTLYLRRIERNDQASTDSVRIWPGPKLEFRWVEVMHCTGETKNRKYWYILHEYLIPPPQLPYLPLTAQRGTKRYAVAVTNPDWNYYMVSGIGRIPKGEWTQYITGKEKINNANSRAPMRISVRERITGSDTNYRLRLLEWATAFQNVRYELGGCWFGGYVHPELRDLSRGYQGFGIDCSKLVTSAARMEGITWPADWREINTGMLMGSSYTNGFSSEREARIQIDRGDILVRRTETYWVRDQRTGQLVERVKWRGHVMFVYGIDKTPIADERGETADYLVTRIDLLESTGASANRVRIQTQQASGNHRTGRHQCALRRLMDANTHGYQVRRIPDRRR
ncbi:MAG: hypothetical protein KatS3mg016_1122 [Fimbriimonadales bacterium]|nr:MAG: hypothetical protein KatS3mg016_1110 [Fimbriimonadales bacterium]GIV05547.1 MAG: hypothetical protein KatS3mg016_1122 [Fimbriimonadales bacterium]